MNRDLSQIGYDTEELYFHQLNREQIERIRRDRSQERAKNREKLNAKKADQNVSEMRDEEYQEAA